MGFIRSGTRDADGHRWELNWSQGDKNSTRMCVQRRAVSQRFACCVSNKSLSEDKLMKVQFQFLLKEEPTSGFLW